MKMLKPGQVWCDKYGKPWVILYATFRTVRVGGYDEDTGKASEGGLTWTVYKTTLMRDYKPALPQEVL